ncbi:MAG: MBL fold metallo-hydrolase [Myxococcota bacterium]
MTSSSSPPPPTQQTGVSWARLVGRMVLGVSIVTTLIVVAGIALAWEAMGTAPTGERATRMADSKQFNDGIFTNPQPLWNDIWTALSAGSESDVTEPSTPLPVRQDTAEQLAQPPGSLRVTWLGHSTTLIELAGKRVLTDPIFGPRTSPLPSLAGPQRWYAPPLALDALGRVDAVLISHDHYDHLDHPTMVQMRDWDTLFITPLGVGAHLEYWGIDPAKIIEMDWWDTHTLGSLRIVATPARHASGRHLFDMGRTLWASYALIGPERRVMFSGDTGLFDAMATIGERYGPFDLVMIEVGAYHRAWPDWHIGPEQAIRGHQMMQGKLFMPIHWGLFNLAMHGWTEPIERVWVAAHAAQVPLLTPRPGEVISIDNPPPAQRWWPDVPWKTAAEDPIISTRNGDPNVRYTP